MVDDTATEVVITGVRSAVGTSGMKVLRFTLNVKPDGEWKQIFQETSPVKIGSFTFIHSNPELIGDVISWTVPADDEATAIALVEQLVSSANQIYFSRSSQPSGDDEVAQARRRKQVDAEGVALRQTHEAEEAERRRAADAAGAARRKLDSR